MSVIAGFLSGLTASMGLGGGFILIIYLTFFGKVDSQSAAGGINLLFFLPIAFVSVLIHLKNKLIEKNILLVTAAAGIVGVGAGVLLLGFLDEKMLRKLFAVLLITVGLRETFHKNKKSS